MTNKRSFSTLRRLKTCLRSIIGEDCLNELASLNIHRGINEYVKQILNAFFSTPCGLNVLKQ